MLANQSRKGNTGLSDEEVIEKAQNASNGPRFRTRFNSNFEESALEREYDSRRQAEVALLANLAFWTGSDKEQMWRIFKKSGLYRPKLYHYSKYQQDILKEAISIVDDHYEPRRQQQNT